MQIILGGTYVLRVLFVFAYVSYWYCSVSAYMSL